MDVSQLQKLTPDQRQEYMEIERRYESDTWKWLKDFLAVHVEQAEKRAAYAETWDQNRLNAGMIGMAQTVLGQEVADYQRFEDLIEEANESEEAPDVRDLFV